MNLNVNPFEKEKTRKPEKQLDPGVEMGPEVREALELYKGFEVVYPEEERLKEFSQMVKELDKPLLSPSQINHLHGIIRETWISLRIMEGFIVSEYWLRSWRF